MILLIFAETMLCFAGSKLSGQLFSIKKVVFISAEINCESRAGFCIF